VLFVVLVLVSYRTARRIERLDDGLIPPVMKAFATALRISLTGFLVAAFFHPIGYDFYFFYLGGLTVALKTIAAGQYRVGATT
jgi:hypothetical protein